MAIIINGDAGNNNLVAGSNQNHELYGNAGNDTLTGSGGSDILDGGSGIDVMAGGFGNDVYRVDNLADVVTEGLFGGTDRVEASVSYTLGNFVENLTLTGLANINGIGNALANVLIGNAGNNVLDGGLGADAMQGGLGNDTYVVDNAGDVVTEGALAGTDTVLSSVDWTLGANLENLTLTGAAAINGYGNTLANTIIGNGAANIINGGAGADNMNGGLGNDTYYVDNVGDVVTETWAFGGVDQVFSRASDFTLGANVENLTLLDTQFSIDPVTGLLQILPAGGNGTGNGLDNVINGNAVANTLSGLGGDDTLNGNGGNDSLLGGAGNDTLNGGSGNDTMEGGIGNDVFIVDSVSDAVTEGLFGGLDRVDSSVSWTLGANVENLTLTGAGAINGTGNGVVNTIIGNATANVIDGGAGADVMQGMGGNDTYIVDNIGDSVLEFAGGGTDLVKASVSYTITNFEVENLSLTGLAAINGTGNANANTIIGNASANTLMGFLGNDLLVGDAGNDLLQGGFGSDTLRGGTGSDTLRAVDAFVGVNDGLEDRFVFDTALNAVTNVDEIQLATFMAGAEGADDEIILSNGIFGALQSVFGTQFGQLAAIHYHEGAGFTGMAANSAVGIYNDTTTGRLFYNASFAAGGDSVLFAVVNAGGVPGGSASLSPEEFTLG